MSVMRSLLPEIHVLHFEGTDFVEADAVVVESNLAIAVDLFGDFHERAHPFLQVICFMEIHEVNSVTKTFCLLFTRILFEGLLILLLRLGCGLGLCLVSPRLHTFFFVFPQMPCS